MRKCILFSFLLPLSLLAQTVVLKPNLRILALGDSYTIGQSVSVNERWPVQLSDSLVKIGVLTDTIRIIATTGWRTDQLLAAINGQELEKQNYNLVSLLIGVNNQFQAQPFSQYVTQFPALLDSAIRYAGGENKHVFVVSIPDYAYTPFGQQSSNPSQISTEIDQYNQYNKHIADSLDVTYIDITPISREGLQTPSYVASDGLHPSGAQYSKWVELMLTKMNAEVLTGISNSKNENGLSVSLYPNPAKDLVSIRFPGTIENSFEIYNATGNLVLKDTTSKAVITLKISTFPAGLYTCKLSSGNEYVVKKLIIQ